MKPIEIMQSLVEDVRQQRETVRDKTAAIDALKVERSTAQKLMRAGTAQYYEMRRAYIIELLTELDKAYCLCCKHVRPVSQTRIAHESGNQWKSDCSYDQWYEYWERDTVLCNRCADAIEFRTEIHEGRKVGCELLSFDRALHDAVLLSQYELFDEIEKAMQLGLPHL